MSGVMAVPPDNLLDKLSIPDYTRGYNSREWSFCAFSGLAPGSENHDLPESGIWELCWDVCTHRLSQAKMELTASPPKGPEQGVSPQQEREDAQLVQQNSSINEKEAC